MLVNGKQTNFFFGCNSKSKNTLIAFIRLGDTCNNMDKLVFRINSTCGTRRSEAWVNFLAV